MNKGYFLKALYIQKNHLSSQAYNGMKKCIYIYLLFLWFYSFLIKYTKRV